MAGSKSAPSNPSASSALDNGGLIYESEDCLTLADAMATLETGLAAWFEDNA